MQKQSYYEIMEVDEKASLDDIKKAYKRLALKHHPDKNEDKAAATAVFTKLSEAYTVLSNPEKREYYDQFGMSEEQFTPSDFEAFMSFNAFQDMLSNAFQSTFFELLTGAKKGSHGKRVKVKNGGLFSQNVFKMEKQSSEQEEDIEDLTQQENAILLFGKNNTQPSLKKNKVKCKLDEKNINQDEILLHFSQKHIKEFREFANTLQK